MTVVQRRRARTDPDPAEAARVIAQRLAQQRADLHDGLPPERATAPKPTRGRGELPKKERVDIGAVFDTGGGSTTVVVNGRAAPQGSKIVSKFGGMKESNVRTKPWRDAIEAVLKDKTLGLPEGYKIKDGPLSVDIWCWFDPPKSAKPGSYPDTKSTYDTDKLARAINDGLSGLVFVDDARIVNLTVRKRYTWNGGTERAEVTVSLISV